MLPKAARLLAANFGRVSLDRCLAKLAVFEVLRPAGETGESRKGEVMKTVVANDRKDLGQYVAEHAAQALRTCLTSQAACNLVIATGSSQFEVLESLVQQPDIDWSRIHGFHLDEYLGIEAIHPASFCGYLAGRFVDRVPLSSFYYLNGMLPAEQLKREADQAIGGQQIDLLLCGIGENGHLAFNDPPANFDAMDPYLVVQLDEACRKQQVGEGWFDTLDQVPTQAISMSVQQILKAKQIFCAVPDRRKAEAVRGTLEHEISPLVPASILRQHANVTLVLDAASSSLLSSGSLDACQHLNVAPNPQ